LRVMVFTKQSDRQGMVAAAPRITKAFGFCWVVFA
jgi:hypothetical protein